MYNFKTHDEVTKELRAILLEQEGIDSITDYTIGKINALLNDLEDQSKELNKYKNYEIEFKNDLDKDSTKVKFNNLEEAFVHMDRITNYGKRSDVTLLFTQAGRPVRGYARGIWVYPQNLYDH